MFISAFYPQALIFKNKEFAMSNIYVIGCTHFGHNGILSFDKDNGVKLRDFPSVEAMDNLMIERWNDTVKDDDIVYHLGDVFFYKKQQKVWKP